MGLSANSEPQFLFACEEHSQRRNGSEGVSVKMTDVDVNMSEGLGGDGALERLSG